MGLKDELRRLRRKLAPEEVVLVTDDGEEMVFRGDPLGLVVEGWSARVEGRPLDHPLAPYQESGLRLKNPERVSDPVWKMLGGGDRGGAS